MSFKKPYIVIILGGIAGILHGLDGEVFAAIYCIVILLLVQTINLIEMIMYLQKENYEKLQSQFYLLREINESLTNLTHNR